MPSEISDVVFGEPAGRTQAFVMFASAVAMGSFYVYFAVLRDVPGVHMLVMAIGFALCGFAESLPSERRRLAGGLRVGAVLSLTGLLVSIVAAPEIFLG